jgi:osmoprotectant transport system ATP-binding protein
MATAAGRITSTAASLEFRHVTKRYERDAHPATAGRTRPAAVNDLSLSVPAGAICVLVGPSGCGKTTSLKMVNRLIEPTEGQILLDGLDVETEDVTKLRRRIGYVIQQVGLFPHQTIAQNVAVVPGLEGWTKQRQAERTDELLRLVGLDPERYGRRYPSQLSGGERQRVGVARALAADPPLMLMDEPFAAVDPIAREGLQDEFLRLQRELAKTILFVTHDIDEAIKMGDLIAVMAEGGHLAQFGPPAEVLAHPATDFVARFVGADRGLKRLSLITIADLPTEPLGRTDGLPTFTPATRLRDALSILLVGETRGGVALDAEGRPRGLVTVDAIASALAEETDLAVSSVVDASAGVDAATGSGERPRADDGTDAARRGPSAGRSGGTR